MPHLHGGEVPPNPDGGPDAWWTSDGAVKGHGFCSMAGNGPTAAIYRYPNEQEAAPIWFHDHTLGATRLNVYAGLAGAYLVTDPTMTLAPGLHPAGLVDTGNAVIPAWAEVLPMMQVGAKWQLFVPTELAYGREELGRIPANSALVFDVELLAIEPIGGAPGEQPPAGDAAQESPPK